MLLGLAVVGSFISLHTAKTPASLVTGILWMLLSFSSGNIEVLVSYGSSSYLRGFQYPFLVIFFGLLGAVWMLLFLQQCWEIIRVEVKA